MTAFVILHYKNFNDTIECIDSIKKIEGNKKVIVVDNNSLEESEIQKLKKITDDLILLKENIGFAKANNKGINLSLKYNPEFVVVINNDIVIDDINFIKKIENNYKNYEFDMLGTKIISPGDSCNPFPVLKNKLEVENEIKYCNKLIKIYKNSLLYFLLQVYLNIKHFIKKPIKLKNGDKLEMKVALHGCGIIFSKKYLEKYEDAFYNETFLYHEEEFLYQRIIKDSLTSIYDPTMEIYHKEGSSLNKIFDTNRKKKLFKEIERLKSLELLKKYINGEMYEKEHKYYNSSL